MGRSGRCLWTLVALVAGAAMPAAAQVKLSAPIVIAEKDRDSVTIRTWTNAVTAGPLDSRLRLISMAAGTAPASSLVPDATIYLRIGVEALKIS